MGRTVPHVLYLPQTSGSYAAVTWGYLLNISLYFRVRLCDIWSIVGNISGK